MKFVKKKTAQFTSNVIGNIHHIRKKNINYALHQIHDQYKKLHKITVHYRNTTTDLSRYCSLFNLIKKSRQGNESFLIYTYFYLFT